MNQDNVQMTTSSLQQASLQQASRQQEAPKLVEEQRQRCEVWTRVMGYHRPVSQFNAGKRSEHQERQHFTERHTGERRFLDPQIDFEPKAPLYRTAV